MCKIIYQQVTMTVPKIHILLNEWNTWSMNNI